MKSKFLMLISLCLLTLGQALGQTISVKGVVQDEKGDPITGATVRLKNDATVGTMTGLDGDFTLLRVQQGELIVISYIGYKTQEVAAAPSLHITLQPDTEVLDEVLVVAYGTAKKESFTGSAVVVDSKRLEKVQAPDAFKALEGMVPGLQLSSGGAAGAGTSLRIRGVGSINASNSPLVILNGAPYDGNINSINPKDIESINVLKDAASAALYGARGANGVIIVTTKNGRAGVTSVNFEARLGVNQRGIPEYDIVRDQGKYYEYMWEAYRNNYMMNIQNITLEEANQKASNELIQNLGYNIYDVLDNTVVGTDGKLNPNAKIKYEDAGSFNNWYGELMSPKMRQEYNLSLTRGTDKSQTFFSVGYLSDKGFAINNAFERISSRLSYETQLYDWLKLSSSSQIAYTSGNFGASGSGQHSNIFNFTRNIAPIYPLYLHDAEGKIMTDPNTGEKLFDVGLQRNGINGWRRFAYNKNIVGESKLNRDMYTRLYITQNARADVDFGHGFKFNTTFNYYFNNANPTLFINPVMGDGQQYAGWLEKRHQNTNTINWNQIFTYDKEFGDFNVSALLGHETYSSQFKQTYGKKLNTVHPESTDFNTFAQPADLSSYTRDYRVEGYFGQFTGDLYDKYFLSASLRFDASSIFAPDKRWGTFWSVGASWRVSEEEFLRGASWISNLKLRASIGQQGNDNLLDDDGYRMYTPYTDVYAYSNDGTNNALTVISKGNPNITWEKNLNLSLGVEFGLFDNRLTGEIDYFSRKTTDLLFNEPQEAGTGYTIFPANIGSMRNQGVEFTLTGRVISTENVQLTLGLNGMMFRNKILSLPDRFKEKGLSSGIRILKEGGGINDIYMVKYAGVNPKNGDALYEKYNKADKTFKVVPYGDHSSTLDDRQYVGRANRDFEGGFFATLNAYGVDFNMQFAYGIGGKAMDWSYSGLMNTGREDAFNFHTDIENRWTPTNTKTDVPRLQISSQLNQNSDRFLTDASFLSLRNITLGYTIPERLLEKIKVKGLRVYVTADNVFLLSARKGFDPRASFVGDAAANQPTMIRTISGGISFNL